MTNGHQLIAKLPADLPGPQAGQLAEITGCCYGIKQANHEYDKDPHNSLPRQDSSPPRPTITPSTNAAQITRLTP